MHHRNMQLVLAAVVPDEVEYPIVIRHKRLAFYSYRKLSTGLATDALID